MSENTDWRENNEAVEHAMRGVRFGHKWLRVSCPFCFDRTGKKDKKKSLGIKAANGVWHCLKCGESGRLEDAPDPSLAALGEEEEKQELKAMEPPFGFEPLWMDPGLTAETFTDARKYLTGRGIDEMKVIRAQIGACDDGKWSGRVIVPVMTNDLQGWLGWVGRTWVKKAMVPYLYPPGMNRGLYLYNHDALWAFTDEPLLIVEGVFDALYVGSNGVAVLGKPSHSQMDALIASPRPKVWVLDGDAWEEAWAYTARMRFEGQRAGMVKLPPKVDPDEVPQDWLQEEAKRSLESSL